MRVILGALDPMPALRLAKAEAVNRNFNTWALENTQRDQAHAAKRTEAREVTAGAVASAEFQAEADLRSITALELATLILSKSNAAAARELHRQTIMVRIDAAATPADLDRISTPQES